MKLNLCCGANLFPGWVNVDKTDVEEQYIRHLRAAPDHFVWPEPQRELAAWVKAGKPLEFVRHDVRRGLDCLNMPDGSQMQVMDNSIDAIYVGQAIEHFNRRTEAPALLRECLRVLKQGGAIRLTTPDLSSVAQSWLDGHMDQYAREQPAFYADALPEDQLAYLLFGASGADCTAENYEGHFHAYTSRSLGALLTECGFLVNTSFLKNQFVFAECSDCGMSHSFAIEAVKP